MLWFRYFLRHTLRVPSLQLVLEITTLTADNEVHTGPKAGNRILYDAGSDVTGTVAGVPTKGVGWTGLNHEHELPSAMSVTMASVTKP